MKLTLKLSLISAVGLSSFSYYNYPGLRDSPKEMLNAQMRLIRLTKSAIYMAYLYKTYTNLEETHLKAAESLKKSFEKNGGIYLKFGQLLASLDVVVPDEYKQVFYSLCENCPENDYSTVKQTIESSFNKNIEDIYKHFEQKPVSSASIAQVHKATLFNGKQVAVKVQHPLLQQQCQGDIEVICFFISIAKKLFPNFKLAWFGEELRINLPQELEFRREVQNSRETQMLFANNPQVKIPDVYENFSNDKVITMEWIDGVSVGNINKLKENKINLKDTAVLISQVFNQQIFEYGFVHADPHQGNIFVRKQKIKNQVKDQIVLLDHGLYKRLPKQVRINYTKLWLAILQKDQNLIVKACEQLGENLDPKLFSAIVTSRPYDDLMSDKDLKLRFQTQNDEIEKVHKMAMIKSQEIIENLQNCNRDLLLLFKVNDFIKNLDNKLGRHPQTLGKQFDIITKQGGISWIKKMQMKLKWWWQGY